MCSKYFGGSPFSFLGGVVVLNVRATISSTFTILFKQTK
jgi:hypothetical protein